MVFVDFGVVQYSAIFSREFLLTGHVGDCEKSYKECMTLMCLFTDTKNA